MPTTTGAAASYGTGKPLIIIAGQSNATGHGNYFYLTPGTGLENTFGPVPFNAQWSNNPTSPMVWSTLATTGLKPYAGSGVPAMGIELALGHALYDAGCAPFIGKFAVDAAGLNAHYSPIVNFPTTPAGHNLFGQLCDYITARQTETGSTLAVLIWIQGETDAYDPGPAAAYNANLDEFVSGLRVQFGNFAFVFNQLNATLSLGTCPYRDTVRAQQALYAASDANSYMVNCDDIPLGGGYVDSILHYDANSISSLGYRFAQTVSPLITRAVSSAPYYLGADMGDFGTGTLSPRWGCEGGYTAGDIGILAVVGGQTAAVAALTTPAGFTQIDTEDSLYTTLHQRLTLYWCLATSSAMTAPVVASTNNFQAARIFIFRGCAASPIDVYAMGRNNTYAATVTLPGATTATDRTLIAFFTGAYSGSAANLPVVPTDTDFPPLTIQAQSMFNHGSGNFELISLMTAEKRNAGAFSTVVTTTPLSAINTNITIALKPAS